jgi:peptide/nickel transport system permease protein
MLAIFIARRIAGSAILLLFISFLIFGLLYIAPGSPEQLLLGHRPPSPAVVAEIRREYHLDESFFAQYWHWLSGALQLDFGRSIVTSQSVSDTISSRVGVSVFLGLYAFIGTMVIGVLVGMLSALKSESLIGRGINAAAYIGLCTPNFAVAVLLLYVFAVALGWFPTFGPGDGFVDRLYHLTLPAVSIMAANAAYVIMFTRTAMVTSLGQDHVAFARARGLHRRRVLFAHALRNALIPVVTVGGSILAFLLVGAVIVESTFGLPGLGNLLLNSLKNKDIPVVQALAVLIAAIIVAGNLLTDVLYMIVDPRIRFGASAL